MLVFFACNEANQRPRVAVQRRVDPDATTEQRLRRAVVAYVSGPNRSETKYLVGLGSRRMLNGVSIVGDRAVIDLDLRVGHLESTTSAQSALLWSQLSALAFQFPEVRLMEPRFNGSCFDFGDAVQAGACLVAKRGGGYLTDG